MHLINRDNLGGWAIDYAVIEKIYDLIDPNSTIIELGSGAGSFELSKYWDVTSVEHDSRMLNKYPTVDYVYAPIVDGWYQVDVLERRLPPQYDCLIVDGPPGHIGRAGMLDNFDKLFRYDSLIIVDDVHRPNDMNLLKQLGNLLEQEFKIYETSDKKFGTINEHLFREK